MLSSEVNLGFRALHAGEDKILHFSWLVQVDRKVLREASFSLVLEKMKNYSSVTGFDLAQ